MVYAVVSGRFWREPLLHFLIGGILLYAIDGALNGPRDDARQIVVDKPALLNFVQYRSRTFRPDLFEKQLDQLPGAEFDKLVQDYIDEEILYREAKSYQLDRGDDVIRQRLIQKSQFLIGNQDDAEPGEVELRAYFRRHAGRYALPPSLTFTHVFVDSALHGTKAEQKAREIVAGLNRAHAGFTDAPAQGDRFPYLVNYVDRPVDFVASQIGPEMTRSLLALKPSEDQWRGPFRSPYGWHAVLLVRNTPAAPLNFENVRDDVRRAYLEDRQLHDRQQALARLRQQYRIRIRIDRPGGSRNGE